MPYFKIGFANAIEEQKQKSSVKWNQVSCHLIDRQHTCGISLSCAARPFTALMAAMCRRRPEAAAHFSPTMLCCLRSSRDSFQLGLFSAAVYYLPPLPWQIGADLSASSKTGDSDGWPGGGTGWQLEVRPGDRQPGDRFSLSGVQEWGWGGVVGVSVVGDAGGRQPCLHFAIVCVQAKLSPARWPEIGSENEMAQSAFSEFVA